MFARKIPLCISIICLMGFFACSKKQSSESAKRPQESTPKAVASVPQFSGAAAFEYLLAQTKFGPRNPGSSGHTNCLYYLTTELEASADAVNRQEFYHTGYSGEQIRMTNIIASFNLQNQYRILLSAHWDTRPFADRDLDPKNRQLPILGANDGASGVAVLLQLSKIMKENPPPVGVDIVLFDGEDFGREGDFANYLLGSKYFARNKPPGFNPTFGILVDMVGDSRLEIRKERSSLDYARDVVQYVWSVAERLGLREFINEEGSDVYDDHVPLNEAGIKTINIIDFDYPDESNRFWHTTEDTPDRCSPASLETVGTLLTHLIYAKAL